MTPSLANPKTPPSPVPFLFAGCETTIEFSPTLAMIVSGGNASAATPTVIPRKSPFVLENPDMMLLPVATVRLSYLFVDAFQIPCADQNGPWVPLLTL